MTQSYIEYEEDPSAVDFGFSFDDTKTDEKILNDYEKAVLDIETMKEIIVKQKECNRKMFRSIHQLMLNLRKSPEVDTIKWPNRATKIDEFLKTLSEYQITDDKPF